MMGTAEPCVPERERDLFESGGAFEEDLQREEVELRNTFEEVGRGFRKDLRGDDCYEVHFSKIFEAVFRRFSVYLDYRDQFRGGDRFFYRQSKCRTSGLERSIVAPIWSRGEAKFRRFQVWPKKKEMMEKNNSNSTNNNNSSSNHNRERPGGGGDHQNGLLRTATHPPETRSTSAVVAATTSSDSFLQWGNRKRLRCMKSQVNKDHHHNHNGSDPVHHRTTGRVDRRVIRSDTNNNNTKDGSASLHQPNGNNNGYLNLRQRPSSPSHRILRNSENSIGMKGGHSSNGVMRGITSPDRVGAQDKRGSSSSAHHNTTTTNTTTAINNNSNINNHNNHHHHHISHTTTTNNDNNGGGGGSGGSSEAQDSKKGGGGGSGSSGSDAIPAVWPPKFVIALTNKEKEEDFIAFKGSKLPQRPKKRAKFIQRTVNLVCPGAWLCDLTLERYEVREKKITKKRPRGLKAMGNMESDSE
ncbi:hypothetical protein Vadar_022672 [Vaccinium darrowii]|uniref:Uncharacterized protein n=1 Tax=Vaccinium darrowii TaxID=229202 RepID=A0ACB7X3D7_9ERIC|nr:hypothetical protein Vadar_022672 [Vaccinium darrowii]